MSSAQSEPTRWAGNDAQKDTNLRLPAHRHPSRIRFPAEVDPPTKEDGSSQARREHKHPSRSSLLPSSSAVRYDSLRGSSRRHRVRSVNTAGASEYASLSQPLAGPSDLGLLPRRSVGHAANSQSLSTRQRVESLNSSPTTDESHIPREDELGADDPKVLADLQRALKYKSEVKERIQAAKSGSDPSSSAPQSAPSTAGIGTGYFVHSRPLSPLGMDRTNHALANDYIDFSPSVGKIPIHPVPSSSNGGATLDWSGVASEDDKRERKWSLALSRKTSKDKAPPLTRAGIIEKQESLYADKLTRIKSRANAQTLRKAEITADQLRRRYAILNASHDTDRLAPLRLSGVVRWHQTLEDVVKRSIDEAEPLAWLRHLLLRPDGTQRTRSSWILSALMVEEYARSASLDEQCSSTLAPTLMEPAAGMTRLERIIAGLEPPDSKPASFVSVGVSSNKRQTSDDHISFEPFTSSHRNSIGTESHDGAEAHMRRWRRSLPPMMDSPRSSLVANSDGERPAGRSSPLGREVLPDIRGKSNSYDDSSASDVLTGEGRSASRPQRTEQKYSFLRHASDGNERLGESMNWSESQQPSEANHQADTYLSTPRPAKALSLPTGHGGDSVQHRHSPIRQFSQPNASLSHIRDSPIRQLRQSLPTSLPSPMQKVNSVPRSEVQEREQATLYNRKKEVLDSLKAQNARVKVFLLTASKDIADHDELQHCLAQVLGIPYERMPSEVLEALKHDPSAVTGNTRSLSSYKAVEDIFRRRYIQESVLQAFVDGLPNGVNAVALPENGLYRESIRELSGLADELQVQRDAVQVRAEDLQKSVTGIKALRDQLKPEYESAGKHTSLTYPELVRLESLLDKLVNQRNRLWTLAETSISLGLSSVAPFMKTFGKPIWNELHDFLVIPWYRNDFSGESVWYPVTFPKRSVRHWLRLLTFAAGAPVLLKSVFDVFVNLLTQGYHVHVPLFVPWFVIYALYTVVIFVMTSALVVLFCTCLVELAAILWWSAWVFRIIE